MSALDKQIGPFPLKLWLVIGVGGIGIGVIVAKRNKGTSTASTPDNTIAALANVNTRLNALNQDSESIQSQFATSQTSLADRLGQLQSQLADLANRPQATTQPVQPEFNPYTFVRFPQLEDGSGNQVFVRYPNPNAGNPIRTTRGVTSTV